MTKLLRPSQLPSGAGRVLLRVLCLLALQTVLFIQGITPVSAGWVGLGLDGITGMKLPGGLEAAPQWQRALMRRDEITSVSWGGDLAALSREPRPAQIKAVNYIVNQVPYREDSEAWGVEDYWATPKEFFARGGDCEDYAVAKYFALRALGFPASELFVLVLRDELRATTHAVLLVITPRDALILDNRQNRIVPWRELRNYRPIYWVNETSGWLQVAESQASRHAQP
jgi:predicted transglutaminase-like cysteine proteinase